MNNFAHTAIRWATRIFLLLAGAVFLVSLLAVASLLALVWGARALWAKLTGRPVTPWVMPMRPGAAWSFYSPNSWAGAMGAGSAGGAAEAAASESDASAPGSKRSGVLASVARDITDVQPREIK
ncbi:hypothetical protein [Comamonas sp. GB3 AK4-5]|uniref:hypothetical protein n=1 Tax=Comamonas sp. GB3 AK4-5 TaxID=3231487 RepID=UPI00351F347C